MIKKVLHLRCSNDFLGAENVIIELGKHTHEFGYKSIVGAIRSNSDPCDEFVNVAKMNGIEAIIFDCNGRLDISLISKIRRYISENSINVLHCHGYKEDFYGILTFVNIPKVATNHLWKRNSYKMKMYALLDALILRLFNRVVGVSDEIVREMNKYGISSTVKISNGVDIDKFRDVVIDDELYNQFNIDKEALIIGMISSLTPEKGHEIAIRALKIIADEFPQVRLLIIGDGWYKQEIIRMIESYKLNNYIVLAGKQKRIPDLLAIINIFILPSYKEGLPIALLEAMAAGKAVVATRVGENENVIKDNESGLLIYPGDVEGLVKAIKSLLYNLELANILGENARKDISFRYSSRTMAMEYCKLYNSLEQNKQSN